MNDDILRLECYAWRLLSAMKVCPSDVPDAWQQLYDLLKERKAARDNGLDSVIAAGSDILHREGLE